MELSIDKNQINLRSDSGASSLLGEAITDFIRVSLNEVNAVYNKIIIACFDRQADKAGYLGFINKRLAELLKSSVYLSFYNQIMQEVISAYSENRSFINPAGYYEIIPELQNEDLVSYIDSEISNEDRNKVLARFLSERLFNNMTDSKRTENYEALMFFLYFRDAILYNINSLQKKAVLALDKIYGAEPGEVTLSLKAEIEYVCAGSVTEFIKIKSAPELLQLEVIKLVQNKIALKTCKSCGNYFLPNKRHDTLYCSYIGGDAKKSCAQTGASKKYNEKIKADPVFALYNRVYKKYSARVRSNLLTDKHFKRWCIKARKIRDKYAENEISVDEFTEFLNKDINKYGGEKNE